MTIKSKLKCKNKKCSEQTYKKGYKKGFKDCLKYLDLLADYEQDGVINLSALSIIINGMFEDK